MRRWLGLTVLAFSFASSLAACGGGGGDAEPASTTIAETTTSTAGYTFDDWRRGMRRMCERMRDDVEDLRYRFSQPTSANDIVYLFNEVIQLGREYVETLKTFQEVDVEDARTDTAQRLLELSEEQLRATEEARNAASYGDQAAFDAAQQRMDDTIPEQNRLLGELELPECQDESAVSAE